MFFIHLQTEKVKAFKCGTFGASSLRERHLATGDFDGNLNIWNVDDTTSPVYSAAAHKEIINCIDGVGGPMIGSGAPELVTGSRDGSVKVWDPRQKGKPVATMEPAAGEDRRDCWAVTFGNSYNSEERVVCAGYDNGDIKMFDLRMMTLRWEINVKNGVCGLEFDRKNIEMNKLVATTLESKFFIFDVRTQHPKKGFSYLSEKVCVFARCLGMKVLKPKLQETDFNLPLIEPGVPIKPQKIADVKKLLTLHFGEEWEMMADLKFYREIIQRRETTEDQSEDELEGGIMEDIEDF
uniref:Uncharacterized protein n=1 Tax=Timema bartmani TaxID=61472 RepID=A0A7R9I2P0_9NEOP|nr:unnamed protein product [Timema bartmani]